MAWEIDSKMPGELVNSRTMGLKRSRQAKKRTLILVRRA